MKDVKEKWIKKVGASNNEKVEKIKREREREREDGVGN